MSVCKNWSCKVDFPHTHKAERPGYFATIDDPAVPAPWPDRLEWERPYWGREQNGGSPYYLFKFGWFASHSGFQLPFKIDCEDGLHDGDWEAIASIIAWKFAFRSVYGIPKGGVKLARALDKYVTPGYPVLIVDDVLTTGKSMEEARARLGFIPAECSKDCDTPDCPYIHLPIEQPVIGVVVFARGPCPNWVWPLLTVNEWAQSRATGLG